MNNIKNTLNKLDRKYAEDLYGKLVKSLNNEHYEQIKNLIPIFTKDFLISQIIDIHHGNGDEDNK